MNVKHGSRGRIPLRSASLMLAAACAFGLTACGSSTENAASVQSVSMLLGLDLSGVNAYTGIVESKNVLKVARDSNKTLQKRFVEVGDYVNEGDVLFSYDVDALQLSVDAAQLEIDQLQNSITNYQSQITQLEKDKKAASSSEQLSYTLQIQTIQKDQEEAEYNLKVKQAELEKLRASLEDTEVTAELSGVVQAIDEEDPTAYITVQDTDTYRIKGTANELNVQELYVGEDVVIRSRINEDVWYGVVSEIETGSTAEEDTESYYYGDTGESASKYNFYVELDDSQDMLMGQHVYIEPNLGGDGDGLWLPSYYIAYEEDGSAYAWGANANDKLAKLPLDLGEYDTDTDTYEVLSGLTVDDYIAFPEEGLSEGQAVVKYDDTYFEDVTTDLYISGDEDIFYDEEGVYDEESVYDEAGAEQATGEFYLDEDGVQHYLDENGVDYIVDQDGNMVEVE